MATVSKLNGNIIAGMSSYGESSFSYTRIPCVQIRFFLKNISSDFNNSFLNVTQLQYRRFTGSGQVSPVNSNTIDESDSSYEFIENWKDATLLNNDNVVQTSNDGSGYLNDIYWDVNADCPNENNTHRVLFRMQILHSNTTLSEEDRTVISEFTNGEESVSYSTLYFSTNNLSTVVDGDTISIPGGSSLLKTTKPYFIKTGDVFNLSTPKYINNSSFEVEVNQYDSDSNVIDTISADSYYYSFRNTGGTWSDWYSLSDGIMALSFTPVEDIDEYSIQVKLADSFFNSLQDGSNGILTFVVKYSNSLPYDCIVTLYGTNSNTRYTGITINADGSFTPDKKVTLMFFANSELNLKCRIKSDNILIPTITTTVNNGVITANVGTVPNTHDTGYFDYKAVHGDNKSRPLNEVTCEIVGENYNTSELRSITVDFLDEAGNISSVEANIMFNNRIYKTAVRNIVNDNITYVPSVRVEGNVGGGAYYPIYETYNSDENAFVRRWDDIYFPETHGPKMTSSGTIDIDWAIAANRSQESSYDKENYDPVVMNDDGQTIRYDNDGRVTTIWKTATGVSGGVNTKMYDNLVSASTSTLKYWIIDNTGYGDISITFEQFHMDINPGSPPYNQLSPYKGDCVVIYNADNENCLEAVKQPDGTIEYPISGLNTNLMEILSVFTGDIDDRSVIDYITGNSVTMLSDGSFVAEYSFVSRICIVVYTNGNGQNTGFKIKAGAKQRLSYSNYNIDETNGELWIHDEGNNGAAPDPALGVRMYYSFYDSVVRFDNDNGRLILNVSDVPEDAIITADYSYYKKEEDKTDADRTLLYVSSDDDYYDYLTPSVYITPRYGEIDKTGVQFDYDSYSSGKLSPSFFSVDTDRGCIRIIDGGANGTYYYCPKNARMTMDYVHHSYYRLSNDGYGDVTFQDATIVAAQTPVYRDVTWCDLMFINEGDAIFEGGSIRMTARGEVDNSGVQTALVDPNRPWDIQKGIADATFNKARIYRTTYYSNTATLSNGAYIYASNPTISDLRKVWSEAGDASGESGVPLQGVGGYISPRESIYGRVIWSLGGSSGSGYPSDTAGKKCWGSVIKGVYYSLEV